MGRQLSPSKAKPSNVFQPRRFLNYTVPINFILFDINSILLYPRGLEQTFLPFCCLFLEAWSSNPPLYWPQSQRVFIKKAPRRENHVNMKTLIPFLFNCVFIDFFIFFLKPRLIYVNDLCMLTKPSWQTAASSGEKPCCHRRLFPAHSSPKLLRRWEQPTLNSCFELGTSQSPLTRVNSGNPHNKPVRWELLFQLYRRGKWWQNSIAVRQWARSTPAGLGSRVKRRLLAAAFSPPLVEKWEAVQGAGGAPLWGGAGEGALLPLKRSSRQSCV